MTQPRFRLRSLLWAIVLIAIALGVLAHLLEDARRERRLADMMIRAHLHAEQAEIAVQAAELAKSQAQAAVAKEYELRLQAEAKASGSASSR